MKNLLSLLLVLSYFSLTAQFPNPGFEQISCPPTDCSVAGSDIACVDDWFAIGPNNNTEPLQKIYCPDDVVCNDKFALELIGISGTGGFSAGVANPMLNMDIQQMPQVIGMNMAVDVLSDTDTGVKIFGDNFFNPLGFATTSQFGNCEAVSIVVGPAVMNYTNLIFSAGPENGTHIDNHVVVIDDVVHCGNLFEISDECGQVTVDLNKQCEVTIVDLVFLTVTNEAGDVIFAGNGDGSLPIMFTAPAAGVYTFEFNVGYTNNTAELFEVTYVVDSVDPLDCCSGTDLCTVTTDLTACAEEGDFGFIYINCPELEGQAVSFEWEFPANSTAIEVSHDYSSVIVQASEGVYEVKIIDADGCTSTRQFEILSDCCDEGPMACPAPENLGCDQVGKSIILTWDPVPGAIGYDVYLVYGGPCCPVIPNNFPVEFTSVNSFELDPSMTTLCLSWRVKAVCDGDVRSDFSEYQCYGLYQCFDPLLKDEAPTPSPKVYPNPSAGELMLELETPNELTIEVEIFSTSGQLVKSFKPEQYEDGIYQNKWIVDPSLKDGLYYVIFKTNYGTFQEKVVLSRMDNFIKR